ncbi:hypothetical protein ACF08W_30075 [Streptomyces sp. NPDC015144]|uniref:hypothetical protein n=1 Tax=Streptomyces sp. NPDC015144 TaxID=3364944 RepID=UPI003701DA7E
MNTTRFPALAGVVCAAVLCIGCGSSASEEPQADGPAATAAVDSPSPSAPAAPTADPDVVPGSVLKTYLPTNRTLPKGWKVSTAFTEHDSGPKPVAPSADPGAAANFGCDQLSEHGTEGALGGWGAYANLGVTDPHAHEVGVMVRAYSAGQASEAFGNLRSLEGLCGTTYEPNSAGLLNNPVTITVSAVDGVGDEGVRITIDRKAYVGRETVVTRVGDRLLSVSSDNDGGKFADVMKLAKALTPRVK